MESPWIIQRERERERRTDREIDRTYIYIYIYTSVNPCISMHGVGRNRVQCDRVQCHRDLQFRTGILNVILNGSFDRRVASKAR